MIGPGASSHTSRRSQLSIVGGLCWPSGPSSAGAGMRDPFLLPAGMSDAFLLHMDDGGSPGDFRLS